MLTTVKRLFVPAVNYWGARKETRHFDYPPLLIGGCGRSGTTILLSIVSAHPALFTIPEELGMFNRAVESDDGHIVPGRIDRLYRYILFNRIPSSCRFWCEKTPRNVLYLDKIDRYFGGRFKFIHIIRDARDVVLSQHPSEPERYWVSPERWVRDVSAGLEYDEHPSVLTLYYENLILEFESTVNKICQFLNIPVTEEILNWYKHTQVKQSRAYYEKVEQLFQKSIGKWKQEKHRERVKDVLGYVPAKELLERLGYLQS
ncbi:MAG: sulfotransferase [candidate division KSB1 bacterium]|nr:sulfotransferase [candidate division KSB1 bacterium]